MAEELGRAGRDTCASWPPTPTCARSTWAPTPRASPSWSGNATIDACRKLRRADRRGRGRALADPGRPGRVRLIGVKVIDLEEPQHALDDGTPRPSSSPKRASTPWAPPAPTTLPTLSAATTAEARSAPLRPTPSRPTSRGHGRHRDRPHHGATTSGAPHDCGRALNPMLGRGPDRGLGLHGRLAEALLRGAWRSTASGCTPGPSLLDYRIPTSIDTPEMGRHDRREHRSRSAPTAPRRPVRGRCTPAIPAIWPTPSLRRRRHPAASACPSRPARSWPRCGRSASAPARRVTTRCLVTMQESGD